MRARTRSRRRSLLEPRIRLEPDVAGDAERGGDMTVWQAADDGEGITLGGNDRATFQHTTQTLDVGCGPVGKIAQCALTHLAAFAVALAQQDRGRRVPIPNSFDVHAAPCAHPATSVQVSNMEITWLQPEWDQTASRILSTTSPQKRREARFKATCGNEPRGPAKLRSCHQWNSMRPSVDAGPQRQSAHSDLCQPGRCQLRIPHGVRDRRVPQEVLDQPRVRPFVRQHIPRRVP